jgi:O-antigen/teichoic acid export membrane protein
MIKIFRPENAFLIDGIGAAFSALLLIIIIVPFESFFGFPSDVAVSLAILPIVFCVYSLTCHFTKPKYWSIFLRSIAICNLLYCVLTITLVMYFFQQLSVFGILYFLIEKFIVIPLAIWEWKVSNRE